ncbi:DUF5685 family protein [Kiritimatiellota bacterium B12222]|nr:DUF5685 family protein [Kiritimatiellota bacterium B12222]
MFGFLTAPCASCRSQEHSVYRAHFCGLCNRLRQDYGLPMRFLVNRDATFLSILGNALDPTETVPESATCCNPLGKPRWVVQKGDSVSYAAAITMCGLKAKLDDEVEDRRLWCSAVPVRGLRGIVSGALSKAEDHLNQVGFPVDRVQEALSEQSLIEKFATTSGKANLEDLSRPTSFSFGKIFAHSHERAGESLEQIGQCLGRVIYTMDAWVDQKRDKGDGQFNPFLVQPQLLTTVPQMVNRDLQTMRSAMQGLPLFSHRELVELILGRNLEKTCASIMAGNGRMQQSSTTGKKRKEARQNGFCSWCDVIYCCDCGSCDCGSSDVGASDCDGCCCSDGCLDCGCGCDLCCCDCG